ncbi:universal stress protein [Flavobacterium subsaxonicum]|uniref:UspA domain-containing protein n=1 Tax=Flavobacterium subsaxonicum WB 4.1-42 = DSM 21790 TaxID=1121898 RepID=A0A0A2MR00_9FLAO|nr:universal stress protein [Flavobacterium subsaxonicum]KGO95102.1 hypothetical protein Q766_03090 [Flavobacterium subsaxonicum WB 4.1-42 = DSM 21790]
MKKILFPTDFSKTSLNAFAYALHLAKKFNAEIITLHVYELPIGMAITSYDYLQENYDINELSEFENYKSDVPKLRAIAEKEQLEHIKVSHVLENGDTIQEILNLAHKDAIDVIIMGTTGATGLKETFLGSITEKVINQSKTTVIAIPEKCRYTSIKKMLFLTQYEKFEMDILQKAKEIADIFGAHIDVLQIKLHHEPIEAIIIDKWKEHFNKADINFHVLATNAIEETALDYIELNHVNMVTMPVHHKKFFKRLFSFSLSTQMAFHSKVPVMSLHA